jgi:hypothetical protein
LRRGHLLGPALAIFLALAGCRALPPAPPRAAIISSAELLSRLRHRDQGLTAFQARGRLTFLSPGQNYSGAAVLTGSRPDHLKVVIFDPLGRTALSFASNGSQVQVFSPREGKFFSGAATPRNMAALIPPTVTLSQTLRLLLGALPFSSGPAQTFEYEPASGRYRLEWSSGGALIERLWVEAVNLNPVLEEWYGGAPEPRFTSELADFGAQVPDVPGKVTLKTKPKIELRLVYSEMHLNPAGVTPAEFILQPPPGVAVVPLGAPGK